MQWVPGSLKAWTVLLYSPPFCSKENVLWNCKKIFCNLCRLSPLLLFWGQGWNLQMQHTDEIYVSGHGAVQWCRERSGAARSRVWPWWKCWVAKKVMSVHIVLGEEELLFFLCPRVQQSAVSWTSPAFSVWSALPVTHGSLGQCVCRSF